ncbi:hypothetical protein [Bacillus sp. FJAT-45350]|nr:hypothetical protein [Bacillus sp. FJAT-45350]
MSKRSTSKEQFGQSHEPTPTKEERYEVIPTMVDLEESETNTNNDTAGDK